jgi:hypothetical protein
MERFYNELDLQDDELRSYCTTYKQNTKEFSDLMFSQQWLYE